jgi:hypothetical protein
LLFFILARDHDGKQVIFHSHIYQDTSDKLDRVFKSSKINKFSDKMSRKR